MARKSIDVIILGLGGMGSAAAHHLASRGKRVLGLERFTAAHNKGSSHGDSRIIRQAYHEHPSYVPLVLRAYELWQHLEQDSGERILTPAGGLMIGPPGSSVVEGAILSAKKFDLPYQTLDARELRRRFPMLNPRPSETAMFETAAGYLFPELAIQAHLRLAAIQGADLHFQEPVCQWSAHPSGEGVVVQTSRATYQASRLIIAGGAWAPEFLSDLNIPFQILRHTMSWFQPLENAASFQPDRFPIYIWDVDGEKCFYGFPSTGTSKGVKAGMHSGGDPCSTESIDREIHPTDVSEVRECLRRFIPALNGPLAHAVACMYTMTPDQHFVLGLHPRHPQVSIAAGFSGHGFKFTSVIGEILADLAVSGQTTQPIQFLSPERFV